MTAPTVIAFERLQGIDSFDKLSIDDYKIILKKIAEESYNISIINTKDSHASLLMKYIFDETKSDLGFYVDRFSGKHSENVEYLEALKKCIDRNIVINVLLNNEPNSSSKAYELIHNYIVKSGKGKIGIATEESKQIIGRMFKQSIPLLYIVSDKKRYRIVTDHNTEAAYAHFSDRETGINLTETLVEAINFSHILN